MIQIRKSVLIILLATAAASIGGIALYAWSLLNSSAGFSADDIKYYSEQIVFAAVVLVSVLILFVILIFLRNRNFNRDLARLIKLDTINPASTENNLRRLGSLGKKLSLLYRQINDISDKRGLKIGALTSLTEFLCMNTQLQIILTDITGRILQVSRGYLDEKQAVRSELVLKNIRTVMPEVNFPGIVSELEKRHLPVEAESGDEKIRWVPIHNRNNEISYIAAIPSKVELKLPQFNPQAKKPANRRHNSVSDFIHRVRGVSKKVF